MKHANFLSFLTLSTFAVSLAASEGPKVLPPSQTGVGRIAPILGGQHGKQGTIVAMTSTSCPLCKKYLPSLVALQAEYEAKGFQLILINPVATDSAESIKSAQADARFKGTYIHDKEATLAKQFGATTTTEVFLLDAKRTVIYRGAVDDQYGLGYSLDKPRHRYLRDAIEAGLKNEQPKILATSAPGCELDFSKTKPVNASKVTYHNRISRIIQTHCQECHREGGIGPFTMDSVEDLTSHKGPIKRVLDRGTMPPWFAAKPDADKPSHFINDRTMPAVDKADLLNWLSDGAPIGDVADAPLPRQYPKEWRIGKPDLIVEIPEAVDIKATGTMPYHNVTVDTDLKEDKWVVAAEILPTSREVVHHVLVFALPPAFKVGNFQIPAGRGESQGYFAAYVPGQSWQILPDGFARKLPKGSRLRFQIHYTPNGKATKDKTRLALRFTDKEPEHEIRVISLANAKISIPPGEENYVNTAQIRTPVDVTITAMSPHMHVRGKACKYELEFPDGKKRILLDVPHYDFNWQYQYVLTEPVTVPKGTLIKYTAWYDNSKNNPANPDPTKNVRWGPQTFDEMLLGYGEYYINRSK